MDSNFKTLIVVTPKDYLRVRNNLGRLMEMLPSKHIVFIGSSELGELVAADITAEFIDENDIIPFDWVYSAMCNRMGVGKLPRGVVGWYYQQFLKMAYANICTDEYYMSWDGDTVPCKKFSMFDEAGIPYFDMKYECNDEYFVTMKRLLGFGKVVGKSFISEHMLFSKKIMQDLMATIEGMEQIPGSAFYEKIFGSIRDGQVDSTSFSEFETYGTFVAMKYPGAYKMRNWHSIRYGSVYFKADEMSDADYEWLSRDFDAVSFEKNQEYEPELAALFASEEYRQKLSARQLIEIIQDSSSEGLKEEWDDDGEGGNCANNTECEAEDSDEAVILDTSNGDEYLFFNYYGDSLARFNPNQAYLCYENAWFLCPDEQIKRTLEQKCADLYATGKVNVRQTSIVVLSYNSKYLMQQCIYSIKKYCAPTAYKLVVVDNASSDGVEKWLERRDDINLLLSDENLGFPGGCNVGIRYSDPNDDIMLLNNDTRMTHNALFWLRMGLYEREDCGATGSVTNFGNLIQKVDISYNLPSEYVQFGVQNNVFMPTPYEEKSKLSGFAMLIRREVMDRLGGLDEAYNPGYFEDDDLCAGIRSLGYKLMLCHNSYIYHVGSQSFKERDNLKEILLRGSRIFEKKWNLDAVRYSALTDNDIEAMSQIKMNTDDSFRLLLIGSGCGNLLTRIMYAYPLAEVYGVEENENAISLGVATGNNLLCDFSSGVLPFANGYFDVIIINTRVAGNVCSDGFAKYLYEGGQMIKV